MKKIRTFLLGVFLLAALDAMSAGGVGPWLDSMIPESGSRTNLVHDITLYHSGVFALDGSATISTLSVSNSNGAVSGSWAADSEQLVFTVADGPLPDDTYTVSGMLIDVDNNTMPFEEGFTVASLRSFYVDASRPDDAGEGTSWATAKKTIQAAVDLAASGDTVWVADGLYNTGGFAAEGYMLTNRVTITDAITVQSVNGPEVTIIRGSDSWRSTGRCVYLSFGAVMRGFTMQGGRTLSGGQEDQRGGGVWMDGAMLDNCVVSGNEAYARGGGAICYGSSVLTNCTFSFNTALEGGGVYFDSDSSNAVITVSSCTFNSNTADINGGAVYFSSGSSNAVITVSSCSFNSNTAGAGGAVEWIGEGSRITLSGCMFSSNDAGVGGAVGFIDKRSEITLNNCAFSSNTADFVGGAIGLIGEGSKFTLSDCMFVSNTTDLEGGAIWLSGGWGLESTEVMLNDCTFSLNVADFGGGVGGSGGNLLLNNCTFSSNTARESGGGFSCWSESMIFNNCLIVRNYGRSNSGGVEGMNAILNNCTVTENSVEPDVEYSTGGINIVPPIELNNCVIRGNTGGSYANVFIAGYASRIIRHTCSDPLPFGEGYDSFYPEDSEGNIFFNPGFVDTVAGDYRLKNWSPCINAGTNEYVAEGLFDLSGQVRIQDGVVDMGAYEQSAGWVTILAVSPACGAITNDPSLAVQVSFRALEGELNLNNSAVFVSNSTSAVEGQWSATTDQLTFTPANGCPNGDYKVYLQLQNSTGQTSDIFSSTFTIDSPLPIAPGVTNYWMITEGTNDLNFDPAIVLYGTNESGSTVWVNDIQAEPMSSDTWKIDFVAAGGITTNFLYATDAAGNRSATNLIVFSVAQYDVFITNSFALGINDTTYAGQGLILSGGDTISTMTGNHEFSSLYILNGAKITHDAGDTNGLQLKVTDMLYISMTSSIDVTGCGYSGSNEVARGSSYGGEGGGSLMPPYGDYKNPVDLGSGNEAPCRGGGFVKINCATLGLDGGIYSKGTNFYSAGTSGGSIWILANSLHGTGTINAAGGDASAAYSGYGGGGGGRIAIYYEGARGFDLVNHVTAAGGAGGQNGQPGSIYIMGTPQWWIDRDVINTNAVPNDYAPINQGQVKHFAYQAYLEFVQKLTNDCSVISNHVSGFSTTNNYLPANLGQLKTVAQPFYDLLWENGYTNAWPEGMIVGPYPWSSSTNPPQDYAIANIGQLKYLFKFNISSLCSDRDGDGVPDWQDAFPDDPDEWEDTDGDGVGNNEDIDDDGDGMPDEWEAAHGLNPLVNDAAEDPDGDGVSNRDEYIAGTDPNVAGQSVSWNVFHVIFYQPIGF